MGLRRKAVQELYAWHAQRDSRALLVTGARQVGKTYLVEEFIRDYYEHVIKFDLVEQPHVLKAFNAANNVDELFMAITAFADTSLVPGKTVIFIDGIQECGEAFTAIKYLVKHKEYDFVLSGSLLEVELRNVRSLPVGSLRIVNMYPFDFEESCWANGVGPEALDYVREGFSHRKPVLSAVHDRLLTLFHHYLMVGGMPAAVQEFVSTQNLQEARSIQEGILNLYRRDISQYAPADDRPAIQEIFDQVPTQLDSQGKRFTFASIAPRGTYERYKNQVHWLIEAHVVLPVLNVTEPRHPLKLHESQSYFKLFMNDVGLLTCSYGLEAMKRILCAGPRYLLWLSLRERGGTRARGLWARPALLP